MYLAIGRGRPGGGSSPPQSTPPLLSSNPGSSVPPASLTQGLQIQTQTQTTNPTKYADERKAEVSVLDGHQQAILTLPSRRSASARTSSSTTRTPGDSGWPGSLAVESS
jgi:hypothetical protein